MEAGRIRAPSKYYFDGNPMRSAFFFFGPSVTPIFVIPAEAGTQLNFRYAA